MICATLNIDYILDIIIQTSRSSLRKKITPARGPRKLLWVVVVTISQYYQEKFKLKKGYIRQKKNTRVIFLAVY